MADDEVQVEKETSRAQRDSEGWANAIVISSDEDEPTGPSAAAAARPKPSSSSTAAGKRPAHSAAGKRPAHSQDVKPDVKSFKPNHTPNSSMANDPGGFGPGLPPNDLTEDLAFAAPVKFSQGHSNDAPRHAGHLMLDISAWGNRDTGDAPVIIGTGRELSALSRLLCLSHSADVTVKDGTAGNEVLAALRRLADPYNTAKSKARPGTPLVAVEWQPALPWRLKRGQPAVQVRMDVWLMPEIFRLKISTWHSHESCFYGAGASPAPPAPHRQPHGASPAPPPPHRQPSGTTPARGTTPTAPAPHRQPCGAEPRGVTPRAVVRCADIWMLFEKLTPATPFIEPPRPPAVHGERALAPCGAASASRPAGLARPAPSAHSFTLNGLMRAMESAGYDEMLDPPGLQLTLYPFQRQSLQWMFDRETAPGGLNALFWREYPGARGGGVDHTFWYNPMAGELRDAPLPIVSGGFLCEEMGLGKTVEMCALVLAISPLYLPYLPYISPPGAHSCSPTRTRRRPPPRAAPGRAAAATSGARRGARWWSARRCCSASGRPRSESAPARASRWTQP